MSTVKDLHDQAMSLAQEAMLARISGDYETAAQLAVEAYMLEAQAAELLKQDPKTEPTRSILYRSAASLAYQGGEYDAAQRLIARGLSGWPPPQIEQELKDLYEQVNFESHLAVRGVVLQESDFQLSLQGNAVGSGMILYKEFRSRLENMRTILNRIMQRMSGREYRSGGYGKTTVPYTPAISAPRNGSFAVTIRLTYEENQQMSLLFTAPQVIDELMTSFELLNNNELEELKRHINSESYYNHFVSIAREIAPDGEKISFVGLTSPRKSVGFSMQKDQIELFLGEEVQVFEEREQMTVRGVLDLASIRGSDKMGITTDEGNSYDLIVDKEGFDDLLFSNWRQYVEVSGVRQGKQIYVLDIKSLE